jgi:hypothetical protein
LDLEIGVGLLVIAAIAAFIYWWIKIRKKKIVEQEVYKTPIEKQRFAQ